MRDGLIGVVLVDDHPFIVKVLSDGLTAASDLELLGAFEDAEGALAGVAALDPDVVVVDYNLRGELSGLDVMQRLRAEGVAARFLVFTAEETPALAERARALGATGTLSKRTRLDELIAEIRRVGLAAD